MVIKDNMNRKKEVFLAKEFFIGVLSKAGKKKKINIAKIIMIDEYLTLGIALMIVKYGAKYHSGCMFLGVEKASAASKLFLSLNISGQNIIIVAIIVT